MTSNSASQSLRRQPIGIVLLAITAVSTIVFVLCDASGSLVLLGLLTAATVAHFALILLGCPLPTKFVVVAAATMLSAAVVREPAGTDLWAYQSYGRLIVEYGENPYHVAPSAHPNDRVVQRMEGAWADAPAVYGPVFVGVTALVAVGTGTNETLVRLTWQLISAVSVAATAWLLWRRVGSGALLIFAANPLVAYQLVHLAHNDAIIGLLITVGVLCCERHRWLLGTLAFLGASLIKAPLAVLLAALVVVLVRRRQWATLFGSMVTSVAVGCAIVAAAGGPSIARPLLDRSSDLNKFAWAFVLRGGERLLLGESALSQPQSATTTISFVSLLAIAAVTTYAAWRCATPNQFARVALVAVVAVLCCSLYTSAWSFGWMIPLVVFENRSYRTALLVGYAALFHLATRWVLYATVAAWGAWPQARLYDAVGAAMLLGLTIVGFGSLVSLLRSTSVGFDIPIDHDGSSGRDDEMCVPAVNEST